MMITLILLVTFLLIITWICYRLTFWSRQGLPNEIKSLYNRLLKPLHLADHESYLKYGRIVGIFEGLRPCLLLGEPGLIKKVLIQEFDKFQNHRIFYHENQIAGKSLVSLENERWRRCRKIMTPLFSTGNLKRMKPLIDQCARTLVENLEKQSASNPSIDMKKMLGAYALDVVASTVFGISIDSINNQDHEIVKNVSSFFGQNLSIKSIFVLWFPALMQWFDMYVFKYDIIMFLNSMVHKILTNRMPRSNIDSSSTKDFLSLLVEAEIASPQDSSKKIRAFQDQEVADNGILFIIAGYDTTSSSLCSVIYCLALYPEHQDRIVLELDKIRKSLNKNDLSFEEINELEYLDAVLWESLRYQPAVPRIERRVNKDCQLDYIKLPKDSLVIIPTYAINRDPQFFDKPNCFDPGRFLNSRESNISSVFMPFAAGPRNCIGMRFAVLEMKICLIHILDTFEFRVSSETQVSCAFNLVELEELIYTTCSDSSFIA